MPGLDRLAAQAGTRAPLLRLLALAVVLAAVAGLPQILATALWIPETNRAVTGITWGEAVQFSIPPFRLLELVIPYPFGAVWTNDHTTIWGNEVFAGKMMGIFLTLYAGSLALIALVTTRKLDLPAARFARLLVLIAVLLAVPPALLPESWRGSLAPLALRNPEKFAVLLAFGLAVLAGLALDDLRARTRLPRWILGAGVALGLSAIAAAAAPEAAGRIGITVMRSRGSLAVASRELPRALTEAAILWMVTFLGLELTRAHRRPLGLAGLALLTAVPIAATRRVGWTFREDEVFAPPAFVRFLQKQDPQGEFRALSEMIYRPPGALEKAESGNDLGFLEIVRRNFGQHSQALWGRGAVFNADFDNGDLSRIQSLRKMSGMALQFPDPAAFYGSVGLRWGVRYKDQEPLPGYARVAGAGLDDWDENAAALPDVRLVEAWKEAPDAVAALGQLPQLPRGQIVVESGRPFAGEAPAGQCARARAKAGAARDGDAVVCADVALRAARILEAPRRAARRARGRSVSRAVGFLCDRHSAGPAPRRMGGELSGLERLALRADSLRRGDRHALRDATPIPSFRRGEGRVRGFVPPSSPFEMPPSPRPSPAGRGGNVRSARTGWLLGLAFAALVLAAYAGPLLTHRNFVGRDIVPYNLPLEQAVHDAWARGHVPVWWTSVSGGRPLLPNPNAGVFYPVRPLLSRIPFSAAMRLFPILHWILGGWGMLLLLRSIGGSRAAAWIAAASFAFSGVVVSEIFYSNFQPGATLLPWSLWALARPAARPIGRILPVALVYGLMFLAGDAFSLSLALFSAALWILLELPRQERGSRLLQGIAGLAIAALLALPQLLATVLLAPETRRMIGGMPLREVFGFTIPPARLLELVVPYPFGPSWSMDASLDWGDAAFRRFFATLFVGPIAIFGLLRAGSAARDARWRAG